MKRTKAIHSISFKISVKIAIIISLIMAAMCIFVSISLTKNISQMSEDKITLLADENARIATDYLNTLEQKASTLSNTVISYSSLNEATSKKLTKEVFTATLQDERIFGVYVALEPGKFFADPVEGYSFYAYRSEAGDIVYENYGYVDYKDGEFYADSKASHEPEITEPYSWTLTNGDVVWLITISVPMFDKNGVFLGTTNCDVAVDTIANLTYDTGGYQAAYSYILTDKGNYVVHSTDKTKFGTPYAESGETETVLDAATNGKKVFFEDVNQVYGGTGFKVQVPLKINGVSEAWSSAFVVDKGEALKTVTTSVLEIIVASVGGIVLLVLLTSLFIKQSIKPVKSLVTLASDMEAGKLTSNTRVHTKDELGNLSDIFGNTIATLSGYVTEISRLLDAISAGDLTGTVNRDYTGDFGPIKNSLVLILHSFNQTFSQIYTVAEQVSDGASQVSSGAQVLAAGATEQASTIEQLSSSIANVSIDVKKNADNVNSASEYIGQASDEVKKSHEFMTALLASMQSINDSSSKISAIIKIIDDISFQTNILALNAAVEAARAGQAGKGFSVVAEEVRNLASKSANAAKQTSDLITTSISAIKGGLRLAESTAAALNAVSEKAQLVQTTNEKIREASNSQAQSIEEIELGLHQFSAVIQTISATAEENAAASEELSSQAQVLFEEASKFKMNTSTSNAYSNQRIRKNTRILSLTD